MIVKYIVNDMIFRILLLTITLGLSQWTGTVSALPAADRKLEKRQEEFYRTSTPCSLSFFRYLFNSTVGERIRPPVPEGSSLFGVVVKSPDHYYPETRSSYDQKQEPLPLPSSQEQFPVPFPSGQKKDSLPFLSGQKQEPIPLPSGQKSKSIPPYLPPPLPSKDYLPSAAKQEGYTPPGEVGGESSVVQTPFLGKSGGDSSVVQTPFLDKPGGDSSVVQTPFLGKSGGDSSVVQTPFLGKSGGDSSVVQTPFLGKSGGDSSVVQTPFLGESGGGSSVVQTPFLVKSGGDNSVVQTPFLGNPGGDSSVVQTPFLGKSGGDSSVVRTPYLGNSEGESSVVQTPFIPEAANEIPVEKKVSKLPSVKSAFSSTSAPQPICECATAITKKEVEPTKAAIYQDRNENFKTSQNSEPPFLDISKVPIDDYSPQPTASKVAAKKKEPIVSSQTVNIDTIVRGNQRPALPSSRVKGSKKGYGPVAAPSDQFQGYEYPSPSAPFPPSTVEGPYQPAPPKPPTFPVKSPPSPVPSESTGYEYPAPSVSFPPSSVGSPFPSESVLLPSSPPQLQPSEGYFYDKPNVPFNLPSKTEFSFADDNNKVDSLAVQSIDSNNGYKEGGLFRNNGNSFNEAVGDNQSPSDDLLVLHV